ncbi:glycosyl transferase family 2 [Vibrio navarrensis]|uniref:hypothetical protein n=1 Tax=Vibrio navarrensis TaxID=29495 RepID=UPI00192F47B9|nr:hypothetical protein [Vibrio navarrensis]MBE3670027.1 glycosyl transferase family 2 [Vibrio navarrensis]
MKYKKSAIFISFDAVAVSGITVEAAKIAKSLKMKGIQSYLDLGYDIKVDKGKFNKPYGIEKDIYRDVFKLIRIEAITSIANYNTAFIEYVHNTLINKSLYISGEEVSSLLMKIEKTAEKISDLIVACWQKLDIGHVVVENGTLPENIIYTKALYLAIEKYGYQNNLDNFVIWRDHDLMWNSEKAIMKYGLPPYTYAVKPVKSRYITYVTLNNDLKKNLEEWCNHNVEVKVKKNTYNFSTVGVGKRTNIRCQLNINSNDILIARTTRVIFQKRLDRDIILVSNLNEMFEESNSKRRVFLVIAGDINEDNQCYQKLISFAEEIKVSRYVKFLGALPHEDIKTESDPICIEDLYFSCDLVSFLTSYDYDSYGNPIGEAVSQQRCYIATSYEYYHEVYGQYGFKAPIMEISAEQDGLPTNEFIFELYKFLNNSKEMKRVAEENFHLGRRVLSSNVTEFFNIK